MRKFALSLLVAAAVALLFPTGAFADTVYTNTDTNNGFTFNSTLDVGASCGVNCTNYTYTLKITTNGTDEADVQWFAVQLFEGTDTIGSSTLPTGFTAFADQFPGTQCGSSSHTGAACATDNPGPAFDLKTTAGSSVSFVLNGTFQGSLLTNADLKCGSSSGFCLDLQARGTEATGNGNAFAPSDVLSWNLRQNQPPPTPEPASLALFGTGLVGIAGVVRRKIKK